MSNLKVLSPNLLKIMMRVTSKVPEKDFYDWIKCTVMSDMVSLPFQKSKDRLMICNVSAFDLWFL